MQFVFVLDSVCRRLEFLKRINRVLHILSALCTLVVCLVVPVLLPHVQGFLDKVTAVIYRHCRSLNHLPIWEKRKSLWKQSLLSNTDYCSCCASS